MEIKKEEIGLSPEIKENLDIALKRIKKEDIDWVHLNVGTPGSGKSTLGHWMCMYMDPDYGLENIVWSFNHFGKALKELPSGSAICPDEAVELFSAKESMHKTTKKACKLLIKYRFKNFFYCLNTKNFWNIDKDTRGDSIRTMFHSNISNNQGHVGAYISDQFHSFTRSDMGVIRYGKPSFRGTFNKIEGHNNPVIRRFWSEYYQLKEEWANKLNVTDDDNEEVEVEEKWKPPTLAEIMVEHKVSIHPASRIRQEIIAQHREALTHPPA